MKQIPWPKTLNLHYVARWKPIQKPLDSVWSAIMSVGKVVIAVGSVDWPANVDCTSIIEPITSRCAKFRFKPLPVTDLEDRIKMICAEEGVNLGPNTLNTLIESSAGDLRKAITFLQSGYNLQGSEPITPNMISEMAGIIPQDMMQQLIDVWSSNDVKAIERQVQDIMNEGYSGENIVSQIHDAIIKDDGLNTIQKAKISQFMSVVDIDLVQGADEHLQVLNLMVNIADIASKA